MLLKEKTDVNTISDYIMYSYAWVYLLGLPSPYPSLTTQAGSNDPWLPASSAVTTTPSLPSDPWSATSTTSSTLEPKPLLPSSSDGESNKQRANMKTPESFLGENSNLVNLDNLMGTTGSSSRPGIFYSHSSEIIMF